MFRFAEIGRVWVPVKLPMSGAEGGETTIHLLQDIYTHDELKARDRAAFERAARTLERRTQALQPATATAEGEASAPPPGDFAHALEATFAEIDTVEAEAIAELCQRTHDWRGVQGEDGQASEFTAERFDALLRYQWFAKAVREALFEFSREGVIKNSPPGPAGLAARGQA